MRPRTEVGIAVVALLVVFTTVAVIASQQPPATVMIEEPSTFLTGPGGARGLFEATRGLNIGARRYRGRTMSIAQVQNHGRRQLLMVIGPEGLTPAEQTALLRFNTDTDMLLAGASAASLMRCLGYDVGSARDTLRRNSKDPTFKEMQYVDTVQVTPPGTKATPQSPWVSGVLIRQFERTITDSSRRNDAGLLTCVVPRPTRVDTLLISTRGQLVALRLHEPGRAQVILVSDEDLFRNRALRRTDAGIFALGLIAGHYDEVIFEEAHHGYAASGSLLDVLGDWAHESPWGWLAMQLAGVGLLALLFAALRFGPVRQAIVRTRRSSLEHVLALATALSAAKGQDEAIAAIVRGLRRRLVPPGQRQRSDWREWLSDVMQHPGNPRTQELLSELALLTRPGQPAASVRRAANLVEDLWQQLRP